MTGKQPASAETRAQATAKSRTKVTQPPQVYSISNQQSRSCERTEGPTPSKQCLPAGMETPTPHLSLEADNFRAKLGDLGGNLIGRRDDVCGRERRDALGTLAELEGGQGLLRLRLLRAAADDEHRAEPRCRVSVGRKKRGVRKAGGGGVGDDDDKSTNVSFYVYMY